VEHSEDGVSRVTALLGIEAIFGNELPQDEIFVEAVKQAYLTLLKLGAKATVAQYAASR
ncbi:D-mannonate oxidoreductase, partial [Escherichia coli]|nr:D-mannonate oxidoreductase [Escherichia coli]